MIESYGGASELKIKTVDLPFELVGFLIFYPDKPAFYICI